ncbi:MAG: serine hydrolase domain-containing protein, partial [Pseudomonadota bacterium]
MSAKLSCTSAFQRRPFYGRVLLVLYMLLPLTSWSQIESGWEDKLDSQRAAAWADGVFAPAIAEGTLDGASIAIVKRGRVLFQKGYGYADVIARRPATERTPFRSGSVNKVFTAIAIMQLVERGVLSLDDDISTRISRAGIDTPRGRTTIRHLLTHSAGFDERFRGTLNARPARVRASQAYIDEHAHSQVRAPGVVVNYSNQAMALAGTIVEDLTGLTYGDYVTKHIFAPLEMETAFVEQPGELPADVAVEHAIDDGGQRSPKPLLYKETFYLGSGGFFFSALDMAKFMNAVLARSPELLSRASWDQMFTLQLSSGEGYAGGIGLGFWIYEMLTSNDGTGSEKPSVVGQGGSTEGFNLRMLMLPEEQVGLFFATVKSRKSVLANVDFDTWAKGFNFIEHFRGYPQRSPYSGDGPALERFTGSFISNRRPFSGSEFFVSMLFQEARSVTVEDGVLNWANTPLRRIGARTFDYPADGERRVTISFSENLQTVWRDQSTSYHRHAGLHPNNYLLPLVASLLFVALSAFVPAIWPQRKSPRKFDLLLLAAA